MNWEIRKLNCHQTAWMEGIIGRDEYQAAAGEIMVELCEDLSFNIHDEGDYVSARHEGERLLVSIQFPIREPRWGDEDYHVSDGHGMIEYQDDENDVYILAEDVEVWYEVFELEIEDLRIGQKRREWAKERRPQRQAYYRSVM